MIRAVPLNDSTCLATSRLPCRAEYDHTYNLRCCVRSACHAARLLLRPNVGRSPPPPVESCRHELTDFVNQLAKVGMPIRHVNVLPETQLSFDRAPRPLLCVAAPRLHHHRRDHLAAAEVTLEQRDYHHLGGADCFCHLLVHISAHALPVEPRENARRLELLVDLLHPLVVLVIIAPVVGEKDRGPTSTLLWLGQAVSGAASARPTPLWPHK
eukprot:scaffold2087_cov142-Isochrysis_galbana.AAC.2